VGPRGFHVGVNRRGMYTSAGIPNTGIYAVRHVRSHPLEHPPFTRCTPYRNAGLLSVFAFHAAI